MTWQHLILPAGWTCILLVWYENPRRLARHLRNYAWWRQDRAKQRAEDQAWRRVHRWIVTETNRPR